ncbi:hypothetical protein ES703_39015 [subsurface metagenome]
MSGIRGSNVVGQRVAIASVETDSISAVLSLESL